MGQMEKKKEKRNEIVIKKKKERKKERKKTRKKKKVKKDRLTIEHKVKTEQTIVKIFCRVKGKRPRMNK